MEKAVQPLVIVDPVIAFLNLCGTSCEEIAAKDRREFGGLFGKVREATAAIPNCDVLFLYCAFEPSGKIVGQPLSLRDLIEESGARVAVIASEVRFEMPSPQELPLDRGANRPVNLVVVGNRNGEAFGRFFRSLFEQMWTGVPMLQAWVRLAPQGPVQPPDLPSSVFIPEAGSVVFRHG